MQLYIKYDKIPLIKQEKNKKKEQTKNKYMQAIRGYMKNHVAIINKYQSE